MEIINVMQLYLIGLTVLFFSSIFYYIPYSFITTFVRNFRSSKFEKLAHVRRSVYRVAPEVRQLKHNGGRMWLLETTRISLLIS